MPADGFKLVPDIVATGGGTGGSDSGHSLVNILLASVIRDSVTKSEDKKG